MGISLSSCVSSGGYTRVDLKIQGLMQTWAQREGRERDHAFLVPNVQPTMEWVLDEVFESSGAGGSHL
jgi:hypothetical protein